LLVCNTLCGHETFQFHAPRDATAERLRDLLAARTGVSRELFTVPLGMGCRTAGDMQPMAPVAMRPLLRGGSGHPSEQRPSAVRRLECESTEPDVRVTSPPDRLMLHL
jgi:hypothetical protein